MEMIYNSLKTYIFLNLYCLFKTSFYSWAQYYTPSPALRRQRHKCIFKFKANQSTQFQASQDYRVRAQQQNKTLPFYCKTKHEYGKLFLKEPTELVKDRYPWKEAPSQGLQPVTTAMCECAGEFPVSYLRKEGTRLSRYKKTSGGVKLNQWWLELLRSGTDKQLPAANICGGGARAVVTIMRGRLSVYIQYLFKNLI